MNKKSTLLVVDDEKTNIDVVAQTLQNDYEIKTAPNGEVALKILQKFEIDLVLLDVQMPIFDGYETAKAMMADEKLQQVPFVFITSEVDSDSIVHGFELGAKDYITKPFNIKELQVRVANHVKTQNLQKELHKFNKSLQAQVEDEVAEKMKLVHENMNKEALLIQQTKMAAMGEMIGAITHQWRQPINALNINLQNLEDDYEEGLIDAEFIQKHIEKNLELLRFMNKTIDDFRNFFKQGAEQEEFEVYGATQEVLSMFEKLYAKQNVTIEINKDNCFSLVGQINQLKQVILNIFNNARDAIVEKKRSGVISCQFEQKDGKGYIKIKDNAGGIPDELLPDKLFEAYVSSKGEGGTGIGLYMSRSIIETHFGGKLWAHNVDDGAEFVIECLKAH